MAKFIVYKKESEKLPEKEEKEFNEQCVYLSTFRERKQEVQKAVLLIQSLNCKEIRLINNEWVDSISIISPINFPELGELYLSQNRIQSIEPLARMFLPNLKVLDLGINKIYSVKNLRKGTWPSLTQFDIYANSIGDSNRLTQMGGGRINELTLEWRGWGELFCNDISSILKIKIMQELTEIDIKSEKRIVQNMVKKKFFMKHQKIRTYEYEAE